MYIQPVMTGALMRNLGIFPDFQVDAARHRAVDGVERRGSPGAAEPASSRFDTRDRLDISPEGAAQALGQLNEAEQRVLRQLSTRDREVRSHEQAHLAAAGPYSSGAPKFSYQTGPDGQRYAVGGEVQIDASPIEGDPEATIQKAQIIRAAANAPAEPSAQDRQVAAAATKMEADARQELRRQEETEKTEDAETEGNTAGGVAALSDVAVGRNRAANEIGHGTPDPSEPRPPDDGLYDPLPEDFAGQTNAEHLLGKLFDAVA